MDVFISYRRRDTADFVGRLADRFRVTSKIGKVFVDVDDIDPGADFGEVTRLETTKCDVFLIVIGEKWRGERPDGSARIFDESDIVRREVREALSSLGGRAIPVLVNDAIMPSPEGLPEDIQRLSSLNAISVRHTAFERDVAHLLDCMFLLRKLSRVDTLLRKHPLLDSILRSVLGGSAGLLALITALAIIRALSPNTPENLAKLTGGDEAAVLFTMLVVALSAALPILLRKWRARR